LESRPESSNFGVENRIALNDPSPPIPLPLPSTHTNRERSSLHHREHHSSTVDPFTAHPNSTPDAPKTHNLDNMEREKGIATPPLQHANQPSKAGRKLPKPSIASKKVSGVSKIQASSMSVTRRKAKSKGTSELVIVRDVRELGGIGGRNSGYVQKNGVEEKTVDKQALTEGDEVGNKERDERFVDKEARDPVHVVGLERPKIAVESTERLYDSTTDKHTPSSPAFLTNTHSRQQSTPAFNLQPTAPLETDPNHPNRKTSSSFLHPNKRAKVIAVNTQRKSASPAIDTPFQGTTNTQTDCVTNVTDDESLGNGQSSENVANTEASAVRHVDLSASCTQIPTQRDTEGVAAESAMDALNEVDKGNSNDTKKLITAEVKSIVAKVGIQNFPRVKIDGKPMLGRRKSCIARCFFGEKEFRSMPASAECTTVIVDKMPPTFLILQKKKNVHKNAKY
jgi:hypothetical protein